MAERKTRVSFIYMDKDLASHNPGFLHVVIHRGPWDAAEPVIR